MSGFVKHDQGKPRMELLPPVALEAVAQVLTFGAEKYAAHGWRSVDDRERYTGAALRHLLAHMRGEDIDTESGQPHLAYCGGGTTALAAAIERWTAITCEADPDTYAKARIEAGWTVSAFPRGQCRARPKQVGLALGARDMPFMRQRGLVPEVE